MTPREFYREMEAARQRAIDEHERSVMQAWHIANFVTQAQAGKLRPLSEVLSRAKALRTRQTVAAQQTTLHMVSEWTGIAVRPMSNEAKAALRRLRSVDGGQ